MAHPPIARRAPRAIASTLASTVHPLTCLPIPPRCTLSFYIQPLGPQPDSPRLDTLRSGSSSYWKTLTLNDIKGKKFAFVSPTSTSGGVGPRFYLNKNGINPEKDVADIIYAGKHDSVYLAIKNNKVDAGAVGDDVYFPRWKERGLLEYTSWDDPNDTLASPDIGIIGCQKVPGTPMVARGSLGKEMIDKMTKAYTTLPYQAVDKLRFWGPTDHSPGDCDCPGDCD